MEEMEFRALGAEGRSGRLPAANPAILPGPILGTRGAPRSSRVNPSARDGETAAEPAGDRGREPASLPRLPALNLNRSSGTIFRVT